MDCESCKTNHADPVPYIVYRTETARSERTIKRLIIALVIAIIMIFACNVAWLYVWQLYDYASEETVYTYQQDGRGVNIIGDRNGVDIDGAESDYPDEEENPN